MRRPFRSTADAARSSSRLRRHRRGAATTTAPAHGGGQRQCRRHAGDDHVAPDGDDPFEWVDFGDDDRVQTGQPRGPDRLRRPVEGHLRPVRRPPPRRPGAAHRQPARQPRRPGIRRQRLRDLRRAGLRRGTARAVRHRRLGPAWHRPQRARHRLHRRLRPLLRRPRHHARRRRRAAGRSSTRRRSSPTSARRANAEYHPVRGHQQLRPRHGLHPRRRSAKPPSAYFGFSYGSELGATWATLFPDTVRAAVLDGAADPTADFVESGLQQSGRFRVHPHHVPAAVQRRPDVRVPQRRRRGGRVRRADAGARRTAGAVRRSVDPTSTARWPSPRRVRGDVQRPDCGRSSRRRWPTRRTATAPGLLDALRRVLRPQPGRHATTTRSRRSRPSSAWTTASGSPSRRTTRYVPQFQAAAPRLAPGTTGSYFCTFFPDDAPTLESRSPAPVPARSW